MSAASRTYGHQWERDCARHLSAALDLDVRSSRSVTGGTQIGADLVTVDDDGTVVQTVRGWSCECKASGAAHQVTPWMRQAREQAPSDLYCVIAKNPRRAVDDATVYMTAKALRFWTGDGLAVFSDDHQVRWMSMAAWVDLLTLDVSTPTT